jgi:hypothetical protein
MLTVDERLPHLPEILFQFAQRSLGRDQNPDRVLQARRGSAVLRGIGMAASRNRHSPLRSRANSFFDGQGQGGGVRRKCPRRPTKTLDVILVLAG